MGKAKITRHRGRYWHAWYREDSGQWYAPTPSLGGAYVGSKDYVCSGAALSWVTRSGAQKAAKRMGFDGIEVSA